MDTLTLHDAGVTDEMELHVQILTSKTPTTSLYAMPDILQVTVHFDNDDNNQIIPSKIIPVHITKCTANKTYLGGYRHKESRAVYHHASTQSFVSHPRFKMSAVPTAHRQLQTVSTITRSNRSNRECPAYSKHLSRIQSSEERRGHSSGSSGPSARNGNEFGLFNEKAKQEHADEI